MEPLRVLIIEDDAIVAMLLAELLACLGHEVCATATTEADAVAAARRHSPDLVIADVRLRRGNGISAVEEILRAGRSVSYLFLSGDSAGVKARQPNAVVIQKPFRSTSLAEAIDKALNSIADGKLTPR